MTARLAIHGIAVGFCTVSLIANVCFSLSVATAPAEKVLLIAISVLLDLFKGLALILAFRLWQHRYRALAVATVVMGVGSLAWSSISAVGFIATTRSNADTARTSVNEQHSAWITTVRRADERLAAIGKARPVSVIEADIGSLLVPPHVWAQTKECTDPPTSGSQRACSPVMKLRRELAAARAAEQLETQISGTRAQLATLPPIGSNDPQIGVLARMLRTTEPAVRDALAIMLATMLELGSTLGMAIARGATKPNTQPVQAATTRSGHRSSRPTLRVIQGGPPSTATHLAKPQSHRHTIERWAAASLAMDPSGVIPARVAYRSYSEWASHHGIPLCTETRFGSLLTDLVMRQGGRKEIRRSGRYYAGVSINQPPHPSLRSVA